MTSQGTVVFRGVSGERYRFQIWPLGTRFKAVGAVCVFSQRSFSNPTFTQTASHKCLCIGETSDLSRLPYDLPQVSSADCVCVYLAGEEQQRQHVQHDLLDGLGVWSSTLAVNLSSEIPIAEKRESEPVIFPPAEKEPPVSAREP